MIVATFLSASSIAHAAGPCVDVSIPQKAVLDRQGKWIELTSDQWQFMRGVYAMHPDTALDLPYGDKAALATLEGRDDGMVFFLDGALACTPMAIPKHVREMLDDIATSKINHEGAGL